MPLFRRLLKLAGFVFVSLAVIGVGLYAAGWRVQLDGGGGIAFARPQSADALAKAIEEHRARQRTQAGGDPAAAVTGAAAPPAAALVPGPDATGVVPATAGAPSNPSVPGGGLTGGTAPAGDPLDSPTSRSWTSFRGPDRTGRYTEQPVRTDWPATGLTPMWKQPAGAGYASFVVGNGRAYTIEQRGREEVVAAYDPATGREIWTNRWSAIFSESMGGDGPRATPTWSNGRLYAVGATGEFRALDDATGSVVWRKNILEDNGAANLQWGVAASPLVIGETVVVVAGGPAGKSVVAYDRASGVRVWSALDDRAGYSSPMLVRIAGTTQIVVALATRIVGLTPDRGTLLWEVPWKTMYDVNAGQPIIIGENRLFYSSGYGAGATVVEISRTGEQFSVRQIWKNIRMKNQFTSSVLHEGYIYGLDESILACIDAATGDLKWKNGRYGYGQVVLAGDHLIVATEDGDLVLVKATPEGHQEIRRFPALDGKTWNHPSFAQGILLVRNLQEMAGFDLRR